jgi:ElaB protein
MTMSTTAEHLANGARNAGSRIDEGIGRKASQLTKFFDDVEELLRRVSTMEDADISRLRNRVESSIEHAKEATSEGVHRAVENTRKAALATDDYVRTNPWKVIGATAAIGLLVGALLRRK